MLVAVPEELAGVLFRFGTLEVAVLAGGAFHDDWLIVVVTQGGVAFAVLATPEHAELALNLAELLAAAWASFRLAREAAGILLGLEVRLAVLVRNGLLAVWIPCATPEIARLAFATAERLATGWALREVSVRINVHGLGFL